MTHGNESNKSVVTRVGVILGDLGDLNVRALKYLIVHLNTLQQSIEFEIVTMDKENSFLKLLKRDHDADREVCRKMMPAFRQQVLDRIARDSVEYKLVDASVPTGFVVISLARFSDEFYAVKNDDFYIQTLGNWKRKMAPPSILEFMITLLMRQSASFIAPVFSKSIHLGTKGCLFDFTADLDEARYKTLQAFLCSVCCQKLVDSGAGHLTKDLLAVLDTRWLGKTDDPNCPAGIVANLGYDLFLTKGITPTVWERLRSLLLDEATKEIIKLICAILLALLLAKIGISSTKK